MKKIRPAFKCHGGKYYLSDWIIAAFPENYEELTYVEPFIGGANVLLNKNPALTEIMNDIDEATINIYQALRAESKEFIRRLNLYKYAEETFERALKKTDFDDYLDKAVNEFVLRRMSRGGLKKAFAWSNRQRGGQPGDVNAWKTALVSLPDLAERLRDVHIFNKPAAEVIKIFNAENTLLYLDPPYLHETRVSKQVYASEMDTEAHVELGQIANTFKGKVLISGYLSPLYKRLYKNWNLSKKSIANHSSQKKSKEHKTECLWKNF